MVLEMIQGNKRGLTLVRKQQSDAIQDKVVPYVYDYIKDDEFTWLDTNQGLEDGIEPRTGQAISEHMRIWNEMNKNKRRTNFLESIHYRLFQQENDGASAVSKGVWKDALSQVDWFVYAIPHLSHVLMRRYQALST
jgi:hypothetical protein